METFLPTSPPYSFFLPWHHTPASTGNLTFPAYPTLHLLPALPATPHTSLGGRHRQRKKPPGMPFLDRTEASLGTALPRRTASLTAHGRGRVIKHLHAPQRSTAHTLFRIFTRTATQAARTGRSYHLPVGCGTGVLLAATGLQKLQRFNPPPPACLYPCRPSSQHDLPPPPLGRPPACAHRGSTWACDHRDGDLSVSHSIYHVCSCTELGTDDRAPAYFCHRAEDQILSLSGTRTSCAPLHPSSSLRTVHYGTFSVALRIPSCPWTLDALPLPSRVPSVNTAYLSNTGYTRHTHTPFPHTAPCALFAAACTCKSKENAFLLSPSSILLG